MTNSTANDVDQKDFEREKVVKEDMQSFIDDASTSGSEEDADFDDDFVDDGGASDDSDEYRPTKKKGSKTQKSRVPFPTALDTGSFFTPLK